MKKIVLRDAANSPISTRRTRFDFILLDLAILATAATVSLIEVRIAIMLLCKPKFLLYNITDNNYNILKR